MGVHIGWPLSLGPRTLRMTESLVTLIGTALRWLGFAALPLLAMPIALLFLPRLLAAPSRILARQIDRLSEATMGLAMGFAFAIIIIQLLGVLLRYVFGLNFSWMNDSVVFAFAAIFMLGAAGTLKADGHVRVDIMRPRFSPKVLAAIELIGTMGFIFPIGCLILYSGAGLVARSWIDLEPFNESDGLPVKYLFKTLVPIFAVLLISQGLAQAIRAALSLRGQPLSANAPDSGAQSRPQT